MSRPSYKNQMPTPVSLLARLKCDNDATDWQRFVNLYVDLIRRWFIRAGIPTHELDDLLQDCMVSLMKGIKQFEHNGRPGAFRCWLKSVVVHRAASWFRSYRSRREFAFAGLPSEFASIEDQMLPLEWEKEHDDYVLQKLLRIVKADVSETTWVAFYRQAFENVQPTSLASELGISENAVLLAKSRVLRRLRKLAEGLID